MEGRDPVIVVLISGSGSNLQALISAVEKEEISGSIKAVISNKADALGIERAKNAGIDTHIVDHKKYDNRDIFDGELMRQIEQYKPDLIILAGFMRILTESFVRRYEGKMLNIHPSLLPKYPGLNTHQRALDAGDKEHGVTVHFVTAELDSGPNIIQAKVPVLPQDTRETLAKRIQQQEHIIYPIAVKWFIEGRLIMDDNDALLDQKILQGTGLVLENAQTIH
ncbi:MAG: phosphoribosylglycinamide formyltransferase-1 [Oleiphilaceae bacterium]|jgi:phosphoribosylglycinamide formyltransferase-1